jgi:hypothetical protein
MLSCRIQVQYPRSGGSSDHGDCEKLAALPRRSQSQGLDTVRLQEPGVLSNIKSALPETGQVGGDPFFTRLRH